MIVVESFDAKLVYTDSDINWFKFIGSLVYWCLYYTYLCAFVCVCKLACLYIYYIYICLYIMYV